jgi:hypothetical protein
MRNDMEVFKGNAILNATFSPCGRYRYRWEHVWDEGLKICNFCGVNPSTADELGPDPTVRRCINFAKAWGYGRLRMYNLFAWRDTDPAMMRAAADPTGRLTDRFLLAAEGLFVCAWGKHGLHRGRQEEVLNMLASRNLYALRLNKDGTPCHPLYLPGNLTPRLWYPREKILARDLF